MESRIYDNLLRFCCYFLCIIFVLMPVRLFADDFYTKLANDAINTQLADSIVLLIEQEGKQLKHEAYGKAEKDMIFDLASLTKIYATTLAITKLTDDGQLDPSDKLGKYFKEYTKGEKANVRIEHLLRHTSGLPAWLPLYCGEQSILDIPLENKSGLDRKYSDIGFIILGMLIEQVSGLSLDDYVQTSFYKPMDLTHTGFNPTNTINIAPTFFGEFEANILKDYKCKPPKTEYLKGVVNDGNARMYLKGVAGHAGLFSNASEIAKLTQLVANGGLYKGKRYISEATIKRFLTKDNFGQGMGFSMTSGSLHAEDISPNTFGHLGFTGTSVVHIPEQNLTVIILTNRQINGLDKQGKYPDIKPFRQAVLRHALD